MRNYFFKKIFFIVGIVFFNSYGYIYEISVMKKVIDPKKDHYQLIIGIGDYHDKDHPANQDQRAYLEDFIKLCHTLGAKLIVEDLSSVNNDGKGMCCNFAINSRGGVLGKLADMARLHSIDVDNVEYRFCRVAGIGPLLNDPYSKPYDFASASSINIKSLYKEVVEELGQISQYDDGKLINNLYKTLIIDVKKVFNKLKFDYTMKQSIAQYCAQLPKHNYLKNLEKLCIFDSPLIDIKIMHSIVSSPDKKIIIVAAGGSHIEKINSMLASLGYKKIITPTVTSHKYQHIDNALSSGNKNNKQSRPQAINLTILDQFIH